jgi:hypothetical protein
VSKNDTVNITHLTTGDEGVLVWSDILMNLIIVSMALKIEIFYWKCSIWRYILLAIYYHTIGRIYVLGVSVQVIQLFLLHSFQQAFIRVDDADNMYTATCDGNEVQFGMFYQGSEYNWDAGSLYWPTSAEKVLKAIFFLFMLFAQTDNITVPF